MHPGHADVRQSVYLCPSLFLRIRVVLELSPFDNFRFRLLILPRLPLPEPQAIGKNCSKYMQHVFKKARSNTAV